MAGAPVQRFSRPVAATKPAAPSTAPVSAATTPDAKPSLGDKAMQVMGAVGVVGGAKATYDTVRENLSARKHGEFTSCALGDPMKLAADEIARLSDDSTSTAAVAGPPSHLHAGPPRTTHTRATVGATAPSKIGNFWSGVGNVVDHSMGPATAVLTLGGAALTVKGVYDAVRAEKDRKKMLAMAEMDRDNSNARETEFHGARMRLLNSAMRPHGASVGPGVQAAAPILTPVHDQATGLSMDPGTGKLSHFNPRLPPPPPRPIVVHPSGPGLMDGVEKIIGGPMEGSVAPMGVDFAHPTSPALRI